MKNNSKNFPTTIENLKQVKIVFAKCVNQHDLEVSKNHFIGKNSALMKWFKNLNVEEKQKYSQRIKERKIEIENIFQTFLQKKNVSQKQVNIKGIENIFNERKIKLDKDQRLMEMNPKHSLLDLKIGEEHPLNMIIEQIHQFANYMNWKFVDAENLTDVEHNFTLLNINSNHPARGKNDCFYLDSEHVLRTHATNNTARILKNYQQQKKKEGLIYTIGNVFRNDTDDSTHLPQFSQFDACLIQNNFTLAHLKGVLIQFCEFILEEKVIYRFRSSYFPFTDPSLEMDIRCIFCKGQACNACKGEGWIELLGGGIISPEVLKKCNLNEKDVILAFGVGIERLAMLKYKIKDVRHLYQNDLQKKAK